MTTGTGDLSEIAGTAKPAPADPRAAQDRRFAALMRAAQDGDRTAYASLLRALLPLLERIVQNRLRFLQASDRDDLVQDILLSLHAGRGAYDPRRPFMPWLMSIARHRMIDRARRSSRQAANELLIDEFSDIVIIDETSARASGYGDPEALRAAVRMLPPGQRQAIELLRLRELSVSEAAAVSGLGVSALKVSAHRAMKRLREALA